MNKCLYFVSIEMVKVILHKIITTNVHRSHSELCISMYLDSQNVCVVHIKIFIMAADEKLLI